MKMIKTESLGALIEAFLKVLYIAAAFMFTSTEKYNFLLSLKNGVRTCKLRPVTKNSCIQISLCGLLEGCD